MKRVREVVAVAVAVGVAVGGRDARACGAAYPGGPMICTMADAPKGVGDTAAAPPPVARVSASWAYTSTTIRFDDARRSDLTRHTVFAGTELVLGRGFGLRFGAGGVVAGELELNLPLPTASASASRRATLGPGASAYVGVAKTVIDESAVVPFVQLGLTVSGTRAATRGPGPLDAPTFSALDVRASATVGKTVARWLVPYVTARAFGGPIDYAYAGASVTGTDLYHYQLGGGLALSLPSRVLDVFAEGVALGERGVAAGVGTTF